MFENKPIIKVNGVKFDKKCQLEILENAMGLQAQVFRMGATFDEPSAADYPQFNYGQEYEMIIYSEKLSSFELGEFKSRFFKVKVKLIEKNYCSFGKYYQFVILERFPILKLDLNHVEDMKKDILTYFSELSDRMALIENVQK